MIRNYRWDSIFFKYFKKLLLFFMIPLIILCSSVYIFYNKNVNFEINSSLQSNFGKTENLFNKAFEEINRNYMFINSDEYVKTYVTLSKPQVYSFSNYDLVYQSNRLIRNCINTSSYLDSIYLYNTKSKYVLSSKNSGNIETFIDRSWYDEYIKTGNSNFISSHINPDTQNMNISISYGIYGEQGNIDGIVIFNIDSNRLAELLKSKATNTPEDIHLVTQNNFIIFSTKTSEIGTYSSNNPLAEYVENEVKTEHSTNIITISKPLKSANLLLVVKNDLSNYNEKLFFSSAIFIILLLLFSLIAALIISLYLSANFYKSIAEIVAQLQKDDDADNIDGNFDELKFINQNIMSMMNNNQNIEKDLVEKVAALKKSQAIALQAQLNPHFLFNTLNAVSMIYSNLVEEKNDAEILIRNLSDILYFSLNTKENIINVGDEFLYIKKYIEIECIKYENAFDVEWFIDNEVYRLKTIKFILQPIVENAFEHGIKNISGRRKKLSIAAQITKKGLIFIVEDNGSGMTPDQLLEMNKRLKSDEMPENRHIGICNVNRRIKLAFGDSYGVSIQSNKEGTRVIISVPIIQQ
jgi:two-component system sensor histidine kinase YesM